MSFSARAVRRVHRARARAADGVAARPDAVGSPDGMLPPWADLTGPGIHLLRDDPGYVRPVRARTATTPTAGPWTTRPTSSCAARLGVRYLATNSPAATRRLLARLTSAEHHPADEGDTVAKRTAVKGTARRATGINPRQPCPCGSGRRYKACHGAAGGPRRGGGGPAVRGPGRRVRADRAARVRAVGDRGAAAAGPPSARSRWPRCCRWPPPRWSAPTARRSWACRCRCAPATSAATSPARSAGR